MASGLDCLSRGGIRQFQLPVVRRFQQAGPVPGAVADTLAELRPKIVPLAAILWGAVRSGNVPGGRLKGRLRVVAISNRRRAGSDQLAPGGLSRLHFSPAFGVSAPVNKVVLEHAPENNRAHNQPKIKPVTSPIIRGPSAPSASPPGSLHSPLNGADDRRPPDAVGQEKKIS